MMIFRFMCSSDDEIRNKELISMNHRADYPLGQLVWTNKRSS